MNPLCVDFEQASAATGLSVSMLRNFVERGLLPVVKFPSRHAGEQSRRVLIACSDLEAFVAQHRVEVAK